MNIDIITEIILGLLLIVALVEMLDNYRKWQKARQANTELIGRLSQAEKQLKSNKAIVKYTARILDGMGVGLPSAYYESMELMKLDEITDIAIRRLRSTKTNFKDRRPLPDGFKYKTIYGEVDAETFYNQIADVVLGVMKMYGFGVGSSEVAYVVHKVAEYIND